MHPDPDIKKDSRLVIKNYLLKSEAVIFSYIFGSFVKADKFRDIDVGIFVEPSLNLLQFGNMQSELDALLESKVDLVILNDIPSEGPAFGAGK
jgi:predicted nucleotidyltransferase